MLTDAIGPNQFIYACMIKLKLQHLFKRKGSRRTWSPIVRQQSIVEIQISSLWTSVQVTDCRIEWTLFCLCRNISIVKLSNVYSALHLRCWYLIFRYQYKLDSLLLSRQCTKNNIRSPSYGKLEALTDVAILMFSDEVETIIIILSELRNEYDHVL